MVLFKDDEERMKAEEKAEKRANETALRCWMRRGFKLMLILGFLLFIALSALTAIGGDNPQLKNGLEKFVENSTGMDAEIGTFHHLKLFPSLALKVENVTVTDPKTNETVISVGFFEVERGFFDIMFSRHIYSKIEARDVFVDSSFTAYSDINISSVAIHEQDDATPQLKASGSIGAQTVTANFEVLEHKAKYRIPKKGDFALAIGDLNVKGEARQHFLGNMDFIIEEFGVGTHDVTGTLAFENNSKGLHLDGDFKTGNSALTYQLKSQAAQWQGDLVFETLDIDDIEALKAISGSVSSVVAGLKPSTNNELSFEGVDADLQIEIKKIAARGNDMGHVKVPVIIKDNVLNAAPIEGRVSEGELSGTLKIDASENPARLETDITFNKWDYGRTIAAFVDSNQLKGESDIRMTLNSRAKTADGFIDALNGEIMFVAGEAELETKIFNMWGTGLVSAIVPNLGSEAKTVMNCAIADLKIEQGIATPNALFMDTERLTLTGTGTIDLRDQTLDLKLSPQSKSVEILDVSPSVNVRGPIASPRISPNTASLLGKLGGLALGVVNPAFLAFSLTDLGVSEDHPCYDYIKQAE